MRKGFIFYKSFYDSIKELDPKDQAQIYNAIFEYQFNNTIIELNGVCKSIFTLIIPQLDANNNRYENGCKGGAPKGNQNARKNNQETTEKQPNENQKTTKKQPKEKDKEKDKEKVKDKITTNIDIFSYIEENFGITIGGKNYEDIQSWLLSYPPDVLKYAVDISVASGKRTISYWNGILNNWKGCNYKDLQDIKENEINKNKKAKDVPAWFNQDIQPVLATQEERDEIENYLKSL